MAFNQGPFHIFFLPFMAPGHMIPVMDMVRLFASRGIKSTIVTTPSNVHYFVKTIEIDTQNPNIKIDLLTMKFPYEEVGLEQGCENYDSVTSPRMFYKFCKAIDLLQHTFTNLMEEFRPNCLVADPFFHWANSIASKLKVPCLAFNGTNYFSRCIIYNLFRYEPYTKVSSDSEIFVIPGDLPHEVKLSNSELAPYHKKESSVYLDEVMNRIRKGMVGCYGVIMNSFYELESLYIDYYEKIMGINKHWHIGPLSIHFNEEEDNEANRRGKMYAIDVDECMKWLDSKEEYSVIFICFGSMSNVSDIQLHEIAIALDKFRQNFILVVRKEDTKEWIPNGFEARIMGRGLIIRGWAPQTMILNHVCVDGFMTHCGWNSILEGVIAGVPMVTWPLHAEQFYNEKLVTDVLKIGIQIGAKTWVSRMRSHNIVIGYTDILKTMERLMIGDEALDLRNRVKELKVLAKKAISKGGSSCSQLNALIEELKSCKYFGIR